MENNDVLVNQGIKKLLWEFSWPAVVGMLCNALYIIVDRIFVGRGVGALAIAATTVAFPIMTILISLALLVGVGASALISIRLGEQKKGEAELIAANAVLLLVLLPLGFTAVYLPFSEPILRLFGASTEALPYARDFIQIIMLGSVFGGLSMGMNNFIRAEGNPVMAMSTQVLGALVNVVLNYLFIFKLGMGVKGSALATVLGQVFSTVWVLGYYLSDRSLIELRLENFRPRPPIVFSIVTIGFAPFAIELATCLQQVVLNKTAAAYSGDLALSAVGIMMSILVLLFMPILGISQGAQPIMGFNYGARRPDRVKEAFKTAAAAASLVSVTGYLILRIWPTEITGLFSKGDTVLTSLTSDTMLVFFSLIFVIGFQIVGFHYFQAVGKAVPAAVLSLCRPVLLFIPLLLILPRFWGIEGVWRAAPIADGLSFLITVFLVFNEMKHLPETPLTPRLEEH